MPKVSHRNIFYWTIERLKLVKLWSECFTSLRYFWFLWRYCNLTPWIFDQNNSTLQKEILVHIQLYKMSTGRSKFVLPLLPFRLDTPKTLYTDHATHTEGTQPKEPNFFLLDSVEHRGGTGRKFWHRVGYGTRGKNRYRVGTGSGLRDDPVQLKM